MIFSRDALHNSQQPFLNLKILTELEMKDHFLNWIRIVIRKQQ